MPSSKLLFVDTNIWLDFYRARTEAGLSLLQHLESVKGQIIITYQVEIEFKKNRQSAIQESLNALKPPNKIAPPRIFSDTKIEKKLHENIENADKRVRALKKRFQPILNDPARNDPVYKYREFWS